MKDRKIAKQFDKPDVETDSYRIWKADHIPVEKRKKIEQETLSVKPGERIHQVVVLEFSGGYTVKVLSKVRDKDLRINVFVKIGTSMGKWSAVKCGKWITRDEYDEFVTSFKNGLRAALGAFEMRTVNGEEVHIGVAYAARSDESKTRQGRTRGSKKASKVRKA